MLALVLAATFLTTPHRVLLYDKTATEGYARVAVQVVADTGTTYIQSRLSTQCTFCSFNTDDFALLVSASPACTISAGKIVCNMDSFRIAKAGVLDQPMLREYRLCGPITCSEWLKEAYVQCGAYAGAANCPCQMFSPDELDACTCSTADPCPLP